METLPDYATSSNLGKMKSTATDEDVALGLMNMIFQTAGTLAVFACRNVNLKRAVIGGSTATLNQARIMLGHRLENFMISTLSFERSSLYDCNWCSTFVSGKIVFNT